MPAVHRVVAAAVYDERSLTIPLGFTWDDWLHEVQDIQWRHRAMLFWLGDAFIFGEQRFGEIYAQAVEGYSEESIARAMSVCREFPPQRRRAIGFSFHAAVMARSAGKRVFTTEQADALLDLAVAQKITRSAFRTLIAEHKAAVSPPAAAQPDQPAVITDAGDLVAKAYFAGGRPAEEMPPAPPIITMAELINLFPNQEPAPEPLSADEAASRLMSATRGNRLPDDIVEAILIVLQDRDRLLAEVDSRRKPEQA